MLKNKISTLLFCALTSIVFAQKKPNIVWINSDDLGIELGCYGNKDVKTPHIDRLAEEGTMFINSYANAPICSISRSSMITGVYAPTVNSHDHRTINMTELPAGIIPVTEIFKKAGYYVTNGSSEYNLKKRGKEDYNFKTKVKYDGFDWSGRKKGQPFFAQIQIRDPHRKFVDNSQNIVDPSKVTLPECYPDYPILRADWAAYLASVQHADDQVGQFMDRLRAEGELENTVVFFFGDNGRPHLRDKQFLYEGGLKVPIIVRYPKSVKANAVNKNLASLIDVTVSSLDMAGIEVPEYMHGKVIVGKNAVKRKYVYGFRQRAGDAVENMRSITDGKFKLIWNRTPDRPWMQLTSYKKLEYPAFALYQVLDRQGKLEYPYNLFMRITKPVIELYDLKKDPMEFNNLADTKKYQKIKDELFNNLKTNMVVWEKNMISEDAATINRAKEGSKKYYKNSLKKNKPGLSPDASYEEILKDWEVRLLDKKNYYHIKK
ncbi:sulfatase [Polaribacter sp. Q13]|uniref:sulfatase family protein n=1 Tax=Polaribacter sp. Q13 TaxID=2806551 RepID=UPI00193B1FF9|nr:sulfatase [Polaribacter sp. Q13]QVY66126.1 sulfatase [Polaribacter sp. Q13]